MRRSLVALAASGIMLLTVAGCGQSVSGSPQAGTAVATSSPTSESGTTTSSRSTQSSDSSTSTSGVTTSARTSENTVTESAAPGSLDPDTEQFFTAFCDGATDAARYVTDSPSGSTLGELQASIAEIYSNIAASASTSVDVLNQTPAPEIPQGDTLHAQGVSYFQNLADTYGAGAVAIAALTPSSQQELQDAVKAVEDEAAKYQPDMTIDLDPDVIAAVEQLPACQGLF